MFMTNSIHLESLMIPSAEMCMFDLKVCKCLDDIWLRCLHFKVLICQVSPNQSVREDLVVLVCQDLHSVSENEEKEEESVSLWKSFHLQSDLPGSSFLTE